MHAGFQSPPPFPFPFFGIEAGQFFLLGEGTPAAEPGPEPFVVDGVRYRFNKHLVSAIRFSWREVDEPAPAARWQGHDPGNIGFPRERL